MFKSRKLTTFAAPSGRLALVALTAGLLSACQETGTGSKAFRPIPSDTLALMERTGTNKNAPVLIRAYKKESELEIWKMKANGEYALIKTFPMCRWSGQLGPKRREGDRQVPEGFYTITPGQMNPNSAYYLSFNVGYPNALDRAQGYTGGSIMVHGVCSSAGCFSMTDPQIEEIYAIAREAFAGGQRAIQMQSLPFRMTAENLATHRLDPNMAFWRQLKEGTDRFEVTKREPQVNFCGRRYVFDASSAVPGLTLEASSACPPLKQDAQVAALVAEKQRADDAKVAELVNRGVQPIKLVYHDGGQHPSMSHVLEVSRPEALAQAPREILLDTAGKPAPALVQVAAAKPVEKPVEKPAPVSAKAAPAPAAAPERTVQAASVPADSAQPSLVKRWLGISLFGSDGAEQTSEASQAPVPLPVPRPAPRASAQPVKPQASLITAPPVRMAANAPLRRVAGATPILGQDLSHN